MRTTCPGETSLATPYTGVTPYDSSCLWLAYDRRSRQTYTLPAAQTAPARQHGALLVPPGGLAWRVGRLRRMTAWLLLAWPIHLPCVLLGLAIGSCIPHTVKAEPAVWRQALGKFQQGQFAEAAALLDNTADLTPESRALTAEVYFALAQQAARNDALAASLKDCQTSLFYAPGHPQALELQQDLMDQARRLYLQAYIIEAQRPRTARTLYLQVLERLEPIKESATQNRFWHLAQQRLRHLPP